MDGTPGTCSAGPESAAKLPHFLFNPFQRYKRDTDRLATWLGATAESLGYYARKSGKSTDNNPVASSGSGRLKGKARKEARAAQAFQSATAGSQSNRPTPPADHDQAAGSAQVTYFSTSEFISLAKFIANFSDPPVTISPRIIDWARRAIRERRQCAAWFSNATAAGRACAETEESNQSHEHFIETLESVVSILEPLVGKPAGASGTSRFVVKVDPATVALAEGRYSVLSSADGGKQEDFNAEDDGDDQDDWDVVEKLVQETIGDRTNQPKTKKNSPKTMRVGSNPFTATRRVYRVEGDNEIDFYMAQTTHLIDVIDVHRTIKDMWFQYMSTSSPSLQVLGLVTTAAADAIQVDHDSLCTAYPAFMANEQQILESVFSLVTDKSDLDQEDIPMTGADVVVMGERVTIPPRPAGQEMPTFEAIIDTMVEGTCFGERLVLESLRQVFRKGDWKECVLGPEDVLDSVMSPELPREIFDWKKKHADVLVRDMEELRRLYATWEQVKDSFAHLSGILAVIDTLDSIIRTDDPIPFPKLFAAKLYLIFHRLASTAPNPDWYRTQVFLDFLSPAANRMSQSFRQCVTHVPETMQAKMNPKNWNNFIRLIADAMPWLHPTGLDHGRMLFLVHPWFAGAATGRGLALMHAISCEFENRTPYIYAGAYLYVAVTLGMRDLGLSSGDKDQVGQWWPRMDAFFEHVGGQERVFAGRKPDSIADLFKAIMIRIGMSTVDMALLLSPPAGRQAAARKLWRRRAGDRPRSSYFKLQPLVYDAMPPIVKALFGRWDSFGIIPVEHINKVHRAVGECLVDVVGSRGNESGGNGDNSENSTTTGKKAKKQLVKLLPLSEYLIHLESNLVAYEPALSPPLLLLRSQACRALTHLKSLIEPHIPFLAPHHQDLVDKNDDVMLLVSILISSLLPAEGHESALQKRRHILCDILTKMHKFIMELVATEPKMDVRSMEELGENASDEVEEDCSGEQVVVAAEGE